MWSIFKVVIEFVAIFTFWLFGDEASDILPPWLGMECISPALDVEVSTTGSPGNLILLSLSAGSRREGAVTHMHLSTWSEVLERNWLSAGPMRSPLFSALTLWNWWMLCQNESLPPSGSERAPCRLPGTFPKGHELCFHWASSSSHLRSKQLLKMLNFRVICENYMPPWLHCYNSIDAYLIKTLENYDIIRWLIRSTLCGKQYNQNCMASPPFWEQILLNWVGKSLFRFSHKYIIGFPRWCSSKESTCQCKECKRHGFDPSVKEIPWSRRWQPAPVFLPGESHG